MTTRATFNHPMEQVGRKPHPVFPQKIPGSPATLTFGQVDLVDEPWKDVAILYVEVVMWPEDIGGNDGGEASAVLLRITPILDVNHPLGIGVAEVGAMRWPIVDHGLIDGIGGLVREDAGGEAGDHLLHPHLVGRVQDVVVDVDVCPPKIQVGADVFEEASDHGSQVDDVGGLVPLKQGFGLRAARQVGVSGGHEDPLLVWPPLSIGHHLLDGSAHQAGATCHQDALGHLRHG